MGGIESYFVRSAEAAHTGFLAACQGEGIRVSSFASSRIGADLHLDVARFGSPDARRQVVLCSGSGGPASLVASAIMTGCVREGLHRDLPHGLGLVLINGVSPEGPTWSADPTATAARPKSGWNDTVLVNAEDRYAAFERAAGRQPRRSPSNDEPQVPAWNSAVQRAVCDELFRNSRELLFVDFRTGPGLSGEVAIQSGLAEDATFAERAARWFVDDWLGDHSAYHHAGHAPPAGGLPSLVPATSHVLVVEFGTYSVTTVLDAITRSGGAAAAPTPVEDLRRMAYPEAAAWQRFVWQNASAVVATVLSRFEAEG